MKVFSTVDDIDIDWVREWERIQYGYKGEFSPNIIIDFVGKINDTLSRDLIMKSRINLISNNSKSILLIVLLFLGIFMPCLIRVRMQYILIGIGIIYVIWMVVNLRVIKLNTTVIKMLSSFVPFYLYYTILVLGKTLSSTSNASMYTIEYTQALSIAVYVITIGIALTLYKQKNDIDSNRFYILIIAVGVLQMFFVIMSFMSPSIKATFNNLTAKNSFNENISEWMGRQWYMGWRAYGLAENVFDGFGFVISIIISVVFVYGLSQQKKMITILAWAMLIMPLLNARTGLVLCFISFVHIMFRYLNFKRAIGYAFLIIMLLVLFPVLLRFLPEGLQLALSKGVTEIGGLLDGEKIGVFSEILGADLVYPEDILFGSGASPERLTGLIGIDSGYIQGLWRFGLIGSILLWGGFASCFYRAYKITLKKEDRVVIVSIFGIMIVYYFKLYFFSGYANNFVIFFFLFVIALGGETHSNNHLIRNRNVVNL
ncbi:MAG: hypothetical protein HFH55_03385 [Lachnospiraceae bacterium]|nr:hypothetical protein [Lachnospiraceae bacterium]